MANAKKKDENVVSMFPVAEGAAGTELAAADLAQALVDLGNVVAAGSTSYLKFLKTGEWIHGRDNDEIEADELLAVNPASFVIGWQGWVDGKPKDGPVVPVSQRATLPQESELEALPEGEMNGWSKILGVTFKSVKEGVTLQYNTSSYGGKTAISKLMRDVGMGMVEHPDAPIALVKLSGDSYKHAKYGTIHTPVITVDGWANEAGEPVTV